MADVATAIELQGKKWQYIIGGDFNLEPPTMAASELAHMMKGTIVYPRTKRGTCRTPTTARTYDYFMVADKLSKAVEGIRP